MSLFSSRKLSYKEDGTCGAFLYDVDKGAGGVKLYMLWLFRANDMVMMAAVTAAALVPFSLTSIFAF